MEAFLKEKTKSLSDHNSLPPVCDPSCRALRLSDHFCQIFKIVRSARQHCVNPGYSIADIDNLLNNTDVQTVVLSEPHIA